MKKLKKIFSCVLVCLMIALPMLTLTACNKDDATTPTTDTPTAEASPTTNPENTENAPTENTQTSTKTLLSKEQAEWTYFEAFRNSSLATERKSTLKEYMCTEKTGLFKLEDECVVIFKNNIYNIKLNNETSWLKDKKYYTDSDKKYYEDYPSINHLDPLKYDTTEFLKFLRWGGTFEFVFLGGECENDVTTIYLNVLNENGEAYTYHLAVEIKNELITSAKLFSYDHTGHEGAGYYECTLSYENIEYTTTLPTDLNTYTLSTKSNGGGSQPMN